MATRGISSTDLAHSMAFEMAGGFSLRFHVGQVWSGLGGKRGKAGDALVLGFTDPAPGARPLVKVRNDGRVWLVSPGAFLRGRSA